MLDDLVDNPIGGGGPCRHPHLLNTRKPTHFNFIRGFDMENADPLFTADIVQMSGIRGILSPDDDHRLDLFGHPLRFGLTVFRRVTDGVEDLHLFADLEAFYYNLRK